MNRAPVNYKWRISINWIIFSWVVVSSIQLDAQVPKRPLRVLNTKDGLPQSFISGLVQDANGFVWIGTLNGLVRYDGVHFKVFRHSDKDSTSISSNNILAFQKDRNNKIWIGHELQQIDVFDPSQETVERVTERPLFKRNTVRIDRRGWLGQSDGRLWVIEKGKGVHRYNWDQKTVSHFTRKTHGLPSDTIRGITEGRDGTIWVVSQRGISRLLTTKKKWEHTVFPFDLQVSFDKVREEEILAVHERNNGEIIFGHRAGLIFYDPLRNQFRSIPLPFVPQKAIQWIQTGPDGQEYLESEGNIYRYDDRHGLIHVGDVALDVLRDTQSFMVDRSGLIWLGTNAAGIHQIDLSIPFFESRPTLYSFHHDLLQREFGISVAGFSSWPIAQEDFRRSSYFFRSMYDANRNLWIGLRNRVGWLDSQSKQWSFLPPIPGITDSQNMSLGIRGISFGPDGTLWVIGPDGYIGNFNTKKQKWETFLEASVMQRQVDGGIRLVDVSADSTQLWLSTGSGDGLLRIDITSKKIHKVGRKGNPGWLSKGLLLGMQQDVANPDLLWIGSYDGLIRFNKRSQKGEVFTMENGLPDNTIYSLVTDKAGDLWLSTNRGLCRFNPTTHHVKTFHVADGLPGDEFNRFHHLRLPDGRLAFGGTDGWTLFDPTAMKEDDFQPQVAFTDLKINNVSVNHKSGVQPLPAPINELKELSLSYDQNTITADFAGMEFNRPMLLQYRYKLEGYDREWSNSGSAGVAVYTKLPPGSYVLKINSSNRTGQWSSKIRSLTLIIQPPFWQTWWAYGLYLLIFLWAIWRYLKYLTNRERLRQDLLRKDLEAEHLRSTAEWQTRFFANVTHEFRTPLTLIISPLEQLLDSEKNSPVDQLQKKHALIHKNAQRLLTMVNQLLDLSKLEAGQLQLVESRGNIVQFFSELLDSFRPIAEEKGIELEFESFGLDYEYYFDSQKLEVIGYNLISNALKFTPENGTVSVKLTGVTPALGNTLVGLTVTDLGPGIPADEQDRIFDRFFQGNHQAGAGTGIGLFLVNELTRLMDGEISVLSEPGKGATFSVKLPLLQAGCGVIAQPLSTPDTYLKIAEQIPEPIESPDNAPVVLVVEDNEELRNFVASELKTKYRVLTAPNGQQGWETIIRELPDLVISDVTMPETDGFTLVQRIRNTPLTSHIAVILLTAKSTNESRLEGLSIGANDYLTKPFNLIELQLRIANLLNHQQQLRQYWYEQVGKFQEEISQFQQTENKEEDPFLLQLYVILDEELSNSKFTVENLAERMSVSGRTLHRKLTVLTGMNASELFRNYRLRNAAELLAKGYPVSEVAEKTGFEGLSYFSRSFKAQYSVSPSVYASSGSPK